jgi:hypothetical protein
MSPAASLSRAASPSSSPLAPVLINIVQSISVFTVDDLEENPTIVQSLLGAFKEFVAGSTDSVEDVQVVELIDGLTQQATHVPPNSIFNDILDRRRRA